MSSSSSTREGSLREDIERTGPQESGWDWALRYLPFFFVSSELPEREVQSGIAEASPLHSSSGQFAPKSGHASGSSSSLDGASNGSQQNLAQSSQSLAQSSQMTNGMDWAIERSMPFLFFEREHAMLDSAYRRVALLISLTSLSLWPLLWPSWTTIPLLVVCLLRMRWKFSALSPVMVPVTVCYKALLCTFVFCSGLVYEATGHFALWESTNCTSMPKGTLCALFALCTLGLALSEHIAGDHHTATAPAEEDSMRRELSERPSWWRSRALLIMRVYLVVVVFMLALRPGKLGESSLIQLGYLSWFIYLVYRSGLLPVEEVGWDGLRGNAATWSLLQLYSGTVAVLLAFFRAFDVVELPTVGFSITGTDPRWLSQLWLHMAIAALAAMQARLMLLPGVQEGTNFFTVIGTPVRWLLNFGILLQFSLLLAAAMLPPHSVQGFILLLLFAATTGAAQFSMRKNRFLPLLEVTLWVTMMLLFFRCLSSVTATQDFLASAFPRNKWPYFGSLWRCACIVLRIYGKL